MTDELEADRILIATGAVPKEVSHLERDGQWVIESDDVLNMTEIPSTLTILGGGRRGVEFAILFNIFGAKVALIEKENRILPRMDREISIRYKGLLAKRNVKVLTEAEVVAADLTEKNRALCLTILQKGRKERLESQKVLLVGERRGNVDGFGMEKVSLSLKDGFLSVDAHMKTSSPTSLLQGTLQEKGPMPIRHFMKRRSRSKPF